MRNGVCLFVFVCWDGDKAHMHRPMRTYMRGPIMYAHVRREGWNMMFHLRLQDNHAFEPWPDVST